jgi:hypothetical protein
MKQDTFRKNIKHFFEGCSVFFSDFVLWFFRTLNRRGNIKVTFRKAQEEAMEHLSHLGSTLKWVILPLSLWLSMFRFFTRE